MNAKTFEEVTHTSISYLRPNGYDPDHISGLKCCIWLNLMQDQQKAGVT